MASQSVQGTGTVASNGTTDTYTFYRLTPWLPTHGVNQVRCAFELRGDTGDCLIAPAFQTANTVESPLPADGYQIGSDWQDGNGITHQDAFTTISTIATYGTDKKFFVCFGVRVKNGTAGHIQIGQASIRVDIRE